MSFFPGLIAAKVDKELKQSIIPAQIIEKHGYKNKQAMIDACQVEFLHKRGIMSVKINRFEIENVKRVKAVRLEPTPNGLTVIGGRNGQGKTLS